MTNLTIKNLPQPLYERLKERAARNRRSLNSEVIHALERATGSVPVDAEALLARVRAGRPLLPYRTTDELRALRDAGGRDRRRRQRDRRSVYRRAGDRSSGAGRRRGPGNWAAPLARRSEWHSVLAGYLRRGDLDHAAALELVDTAAALVAGREYLVDGASVLSLVRSSPCSAYDCEYVALADTLGVPLVTYDRQVLAAFPGRTTTPSGYAPR
ncbi:MAG: Arc family DNA-binding protein [Gemmatimonadota bacterium]|nr:Arc family DNA-binding protein [Gemmatimonadota bacterium]